MTSSADFVARQAEHGAQIKQLQKNDETLFELHNGPVSEAMKQVERITDNNERTAESLERLNKKIDSVKDKQMICSAEREHDRRRSDGAMKKVAHYGAIAAIVAFIGGFLLTAYKGLYLLIAKGIH